MTRKHTFKEPDTHAADLERTLRQIQIVADLSLKLGVMEPRAQFALRWIADECAGLVGEGVEG